MDKREHTVRMVISFLLTMSENSIGKVLIIYTDLIVQKGHEKNECKALCQMAARSRVSGKVILLADRNYESRNTLLHLP